MGQQQLFFLVLATIIVGFVALGALAAFERVMRQSAAEQMSQTALSIASDVQSYARKPSIFKSQNSTGQNALQVGFGELSHYDPTSGGYYVDDVATYSLNGQGALPDGYDSGACPNNSPVNTVEAYSSEYDVSVCVTIRGTSSDDLDSGIIMGE